jgi:hypothetical protein
MKKNVARILRYALEQLVIVERLKSVTAEVTKGTGRAVASIHNVLWLLESEQEKGPVLRKRLLPHPVQWGELADDTVINAVEEICKREVDPIADPPQADPPGGWTPGAIDQAAFKPQVTLDQANHQLCALPNPPLSRKMSRFVKLGKLLESVVGDNRLGAVKYSYLRSKIDEVDKQLEATDATGNVRDFIEMEVVPPFQNVAIKPLRFFLTLLHGDTINEAKVLGFTFQYKGSNPALWRFGEANDIKKLGIPWIQCGDAVEAINACNAKWQEILSKYVTVEQPKPKIELPEKVIRWIALGKNAENVVANGFDFGKKDIDRVDSELGVYAKQALDAVAACIKQS